MDLRRAVSAAYYALFHRLTAASAEAFKSAGPVVTNQAVRAFNHLAMRKVCEAYVRNASRPFPQLEPFTPHDPDERLIQIAALFIDLQDARQRADYDLAVGFDYDFAVNLVSGTIKAFADFKEIDDLPETKAFLTALLLADRWTRRG